MYFDLFYLVVSLSSYSIGPVIILIDTHKILEFVFDLLREAGEDGFKIQDLLKTLCLSGCILAILQI